MAHEVVFAPEARDDLVGLYLYIAERLGDVRALAYVERIEAYCHGFADFPERGTRRDDLVPGLRLIGFERRVTIAFHVDPGRVIFDRGMSPLPCEAQPRNAQPLASMSFAARRFAACTSGRQENGVTPILYLSP